MVFLSSWELITCIISISIVLLKVAFYASAFRRRRHYVFGLSVRPSVCPSEAWNTLFWPVHWSVGPPDQPQPFYRISVRPSVCPSVRPERFPGICRRMHAGIGLTFYKLMYLDHFQNWLVYGQSLLIFLILALFWLSETGQIWGFRAFPGERMEGMAWNFARYFDLVKRVKFRVSGHFPKKAWRKWPEILHADVSWPSSELISLWPWFVDFANFGTILT